MRWPSLKQGNRSGGSGSNVGASGSAGSTSDGGSHSSDAASGGDSGNGGSSDGSNAGGSSSNGSNGSNGSSGGTSGEPGSGGASAAGGSNGGGGSHGELGSGGSSGAGGSDPAEPLSIEEFDEELVEIYCAWLPSCCGVLGLELTQADCRTRLGAAYEAQRTNIDPAHYTYDADAAGECAVGLRQYYAAVGCDGDAEAVGFDLARVASCQRVFAGKLEPGSVCMSDIECAEGSDEWADCTTVDPEDARTWCVANRRAKEGDDCFWNCSERQCVGGPDAIPAVSGWCYESDGLYCTTDNVCERQSALGEACIGTSACHDSYCELDECVALGSLGAPCESDLQCDSPLLCDDDSLECVAAKSNGEPCDLHVECQSQLCHPDLRECVQPLDIDATAVLSCRALAE